MPTKSCNNGVDFVLPLFDHHRENSQKSFNRLGNLRHPNWQKRSSLFSFHSNNLPEHRAHPLNSLGRGLQLCSCVFIHFFPHFSNSRSSPVIASSMDHLEPELCCGRRRVSAVILDLDGTLLDTERATKGVLAEFLAKYGKVLDDEREDKKRLGMTQRDSAVSIVEDYELPLTPDQFIQEITPMYREKWLYAKPLPGANRLIKHLHAHKVPFALASNSLLEYIEAKISHQQGWKEFFAVILGSDQVREGKPAPYLFEEAAKRLGMAASECLVIEDSLVGVKAAKAAKMKVVAVPPHGETDCSSLADSVLSSLLELQPELWGLPPFQDWVDNALPVDPIRITAHFANGSTCQVSDGLLPDQALGIYFGWAEVDEVGTTLKIVVSIGWDHCSCTSMGKYLKLWAIDGVKPDQQMQLLLVGYIKRFDSKEVMTMVDVNEIEEYKSIANASLDLPFFLNHLRE